MNRKLQCALTVAGAIFFTFFGSFQAVAQSDPDTRANEKDLEERIFNLSLLRKGKSTDKHSNSQVTLAQVQADFTRLQVVNNDLAEAVDRKTSLSLDFVAKSAAEIHNLAQRLMTSLSQAKSSKESKRADSASIGDREQLRQSLIELDRVIGEFTHNPVFKEASPDDEKLGAKALRDLDRIITLSGQAQKSASKLLEQP